MHCPEVLQSLQDSPRRLTCSPIFPPPTLAWVFSSQLLPPTDPSGLPSTPLLSPKHSATPPPPHLLTPTSPGRFSPFSQQPPPQTRSARSLHPHFVPLPHNFSPSLRSSRLFPGWATAPPAHLGGNGRGLFTWWPQNSGAAAPRGRGGKHSPNGFPPPLAPNWEPTTDSLPA